AQAGVASPAGQFRPALAWGLSAGLRLGARLGAEVGVIRASHAVENSSLRIGSTSAVLGAVVEVDALPVVPTLSLGPALQLASRSDGRGETVVTPAGFVGLGLRARLFRYVHAAAQVQYLTAAFGGDRFPAYSTVLLQVGWTGEL
ncbi:MAG: hypothetical protein ACK4N5_23745, partial [Myxococcales bacterium]